MNKRLRNVGLYVLAVITIIFIGTSVFDKPNTENATKTLRYSDFIEAVQDKEVSRVLISPDNGTAQVIENDGSRSEVNLAPDKDLLKILTWFRQSNKQVQFVIVTNGSYKTDAWWKELNGILTEKDHIHFSILKLNIHSSQK